MKRLLVLGAGTAGTMVVNKLRPLLPEDEWSITIVDQSTAHHYQPGYLFIPFGGYAAEEVTKPTGAFIPDGVEHLVATVERVEPETNRVHLEGSGVLEYDQLVIATGITPRPELTTGMGGSLWRESIFDFYTLDGATALADSLRTWKGGRLVVHIAEMPIKCPVAPLEFAFLADAYFRSAGMRNSVEIVYVTPLDGAFTKPIAAERLGGMLEKRQIALETDFYIERIDEAGKALVSYDERRIAFDLLVTVPINLGADFVGKSGLGDEINCVPVDPGTFLSTQWGNIFALGDAASLPTSKAGSVAHFAVELFVSNFLQHIRGEEMTHHFDGHANCFVESGDGKALLLDFNYDVQPLPGKFPLPGVGPFSLLKETRINHLGKLLFKWMYWHMLLPGRDLPLPSRMSMAGKRDASSQSNQP